MQRPGSERFIRGLACSEKMSFNAEFEQEKVKSRQKKMALINILDIYRKICLPCRKIEKILDMGDDFFAYIQ